MLFILKAWLVDFERLFAAAADSLDHYEEEWHRVGRPTPVWRSITFLVHLDSSSSGSRRKATYPWGTLMDQMRGALWLVTTAVGRPIPIWTSITLLLYPDGRSVRRREATYPWGTSMERPGIQGWSTEIR
jgi:hypothetical protein